MNKEDFELAKNTMKNSYSPYSCFQVGAVLRTKSGKLYTGTNIENHGIQGICAERVAFAKALSEGERAYECITIVGAPKGKRIRTKCLPCGYCRQFMCEFVDESFKIYVAASDKNYDCFTIGDLLPNAFKL